MNKQESLDFLFTYKRFEDYDKLFATQTTNEALKYIELSKLKNDIYLYLWAYHVSFAYEIHWADLQSMSQEQKDTYNKCYPDANADTEPPKNFNPNIILSTVGRWHIADAAVDRLR